MKRLSLLLFLLVALCFDSFACTSAVVAPHRSSEGVPLLWKHRDATFNKVCVDYITSGKYAYTAVVPHNKGLKIAFAGINETGFGIINTATENLQAASIEEYSACTYKEVDWNELYHFALQNFSTVDEYEVLLRNTKRKHKFSANIAVADGTGAVAYFEISDLHYYRYNTTDHKEGFDVRSNFSFAGVEDKRGPSTRRYDIIMQEMSTHKGKFSPQQFFSYSRSYNSCAYGDILTSHDEYICSNHTVPRLGTAGVFVLVCDAKCPRMLVTIGHSVSGIAVPIYVQAKHNIPECAKSNNMQLLSNDFKAKAYHWVKGKGAMLHKDIIRHVLKIKQPRIDFPQQLPANIEACNANIDKQFNKHAVRVRRVLAKF